MFNRRPAAWVALLVTLVPFAALRADSSLEDRLNARLKEMECPGALVGIFPDDGPSRTFALGVADLESERPMSLDMHMRIGSVTKTFVGTVVLQLADEGTLSLDDPVAKYVEGVPGGEKITIRQLGNHTSGLYNSLQDRKFQYAIMANPEKDWSPKEILAVAFAHDPYFEPGTGFRYSNTNTVVLGLVIERVTGKTWAEAVEKRILRPLGMEHTGVPVEGGELPEPHPSAYRNGDGDRIIGYGDTFHDVSNYSASNTGAAGNLYSTLADLGKATRALATGELLKVAGKRELHRWTDTGDDGFGYGFCLGRFAEGIGHQGDVPGFNATAVYYPERKCAIVALTNLSNNKDRTMPAEELAKLALESLKSSE